MSEVFSSKTVLTTDLEQLAALSAQIGELLGHAPPLVEAEIVHYNAHLAVHELCVNIIKHAFDGGPGKFTLTLALDDDPWRIEASTHDQGHLRFNLAEWAPPDLDDLPVHGLGIFLIHRLMDEVSCTTGADGNRWHLVKRLQLAEEEAPAAAHASPTGSTTAHSTPAEAKT